MKMFPRKEEPLESVSSKLQPSWVSSLTISIQRIHFLDIVTLVLSYIVLIWTIHLCLPAWKANSKALQKFGFVRGGKGFFSFLKLTKDCAFGKTSQRLFREGYERIRTTSTLFIMPMPASQSGLMLMLPKDMIAEYARQPQNIVSFYTYLKGAMHSRYTLFTDKILDVPQHVQVVRYELHKKLEDKMSIVHDEMIQAMGSRIIPFMKDGTAKINVWTTVESTLAQVNLRVLFGREHSRKPGYLKASIAYFSRLFPTAVMTRFLPPLIRPLFAPFICLPLRLARNRWVDLTMPLIKSRMPVDLEDLPQDILTACMRAARNSEDPRAEFTPDLLAHRVLIMHFLMSFSVTITLTNAIFDLVSLPKNMFQQLISDLRKEISDVLDNEGGWSSRLVYRLDLMDSFIRESIRRNPIGETGLERTVIAGDGFTFENGVHVPKGTTLAVPIFGIQNDESFYPGGFDPYRWVKDEKQKTFATIGPDYLAFGLGIPACPGRYYAQNIIKLALAHLIMQYDFERLEQRPEPHRVVTLMQPNRKAMLNLRRRFEFNQHILSLYYKE